MELNIEVNLVTKEPVSDVEALQLAMSFVNSVTFDVHGLKVSVNGTEILNQVH